MNHDVIVIGASAGGVEVLLDLVAALPSDLPASLFIALHTTPAGGSMLPELLSSRGLLPASYPLHDQQILRSHIYVAPPDNQLLLRAGSMEVVRGPRENGHRPAADALFRTAAAAYGSRVIGVVLSGYQDCGTAGMMSVKARGGVAVVQAPESALVSEMPRNAIAQLAVDFVVTPVELPGLLIELVATPAGPAARPTGLVEQLEGAAPGAPADLVCPICSGVLTETRAGEFSHFRCHVGHTFSLQSLVHEQGEGMERALWAAVRALEESAALSRRLSQSERGAVAQRFAEKAFTQTQHADLIRQILLHGAAMTGPDPSQP